MGLAATRAVRLDCAATFTASPTTFNVYCILHTQHIHGPTHNISFDRRLVPCKWSLPTAHCCYCPYHESEFEALQTDNHIRVRMCACVRVTRVKSEIEDLGPYLHRGGLYWRVAIYWVASSVKYVVISSTLFAHANTSFIFVSIRMHRGCATMRLCCVSTWRRIQFFIMGDG